MTSLTLQTRQLALGAAAPLRLGRVAELVGLHLLVTGLPAGAGR